MRQNEVNAAELRHKILEIMFLRKLKGKLETGSLLTQSIFLPIRRFFFVTVDVLVEAVVILSDALLTKMLV